MKTNSDYQNYLRAMQNYEISEGRKNYQTPFENDFQEIYNRAKIISPVPPSMTNEVHDAYMSAMNSLSDKEKLMSMILIFDPARLPSKINDTPYTPITIDYHFLKNRVENITNPKNGGYSSQELKSSVHAFWNSFNDTYKGDKSVNPTEETSADIDRFLYNLRTKGAAKFLADLNQEKIEKLVEEYKQKLIEQMGDSPEAMVEIEKLVEQFKKQLIEEMREKTEEEAKHKKPNDTPLSSNSFVEELISLQNKKTIKPLEELLKV